MRTGSASAQTRAYSGGLLARRPQHATAAQKFPFLSGVYFDAFWVIFLACITRVTLLPDLNSLAWAAADGLALYAVAQNPALYAEVFRRNIVIVAWPTLAIVSTLWSLDPNLTFYHAIQFLLNTVVAFVLMRHAGLERFVRILFYFGFVLQGLSVLFSLVGAGFVIDGVGYFKGVYIHKNELGVFSTLQLICATALFLSGWKRWLSGAGVALALVTLVKSSSGTSLLLSVMVIGLFPLFLIMRRGLAPAGITIGMALTLTAGAALILVVSQFDVVNYVLFSLGKDPGLTGRDEIWAIGIDAAMDRPWLGHGFLAYWTSTESTAAYLRYVLKQDLLAFHNVYLETTVAFGVVGLALMAAGLAQQIIRGFVFLVRRADVLALTPLLFILWISVLCMSENPIFWNSQLHFMVAAFAAATCGARTAKG